MRVTLVHPRMGGRGNVRSLRTWEMQPLWAAVLKAYTPSGVELRLLDDRLEEIDYDTGTDLVGINVETFTARRAYEIASGFRARGVPVVMGGFHATLVADEVQRYAEAVVVGEAETVWGDLLSDAAAGRLKPRYEGDGPVSLDGRDPDRSVFDGKSYLPLELVEAGRGCPHACEFCSVSRFHGGRYRRRPVEAVLDEVRRLRTKRVFFVDDNIFGERADARRLFDGLRPLGVTWVGQGSLELSDDPTMLDAVAKSGCACLLVGIESLDPANLEAMGKRVNAARSDYDSVLARFREKRLPLYCTMLLGYDHDTIDTPDRLFAFATRNKLFMAAFNHVTPFPGTPLYARLGDEGRLRYERWWLDPAYEYGCLPFEPAGVAAGPLEDACQVMRGRFYGPRSIAHRALSRQNVGSPGRAAAFAAANLSLMRDVRRRDRLHLGDPSFEGELLEVRAPAAERVE